MGKCFLGVWTGALFALTFVVSELSGPRTDLGYFIAGALEWILIGGLLTGIAITGYTLYTVFEWWRTRP